MSIVPLNIECKDMNEFAQGSQLTEVFIIVSITFPLN